MDWTACIRQAIAYMEEHMKEDISMTALSREIGVSSYYFQKGFSMLCGMTVGEYLRCRRLSLAGRDLVLSESKIIDIALDYGYDSPDSFTKAFSRTIPALNWAVFPCHGPMPESIQAVEKQIFAQWLPNNGYQFSAGYNIERYDDPRQYEKGTRDEKYYCEVWSPVKESE